MVVHLTEYGPIFAAVAAVIAALLAWHSSRKPKVDAAQVEQIESEIEKDQESVNLERAKANAKRDRHIVRLENYLFAEVRPWGRQAVVLNGEQNDIIVAMAARMDIEYSPKRLPPFPEMPTIDDE